MSHGLWPESAHALHTLSNLHEYGSMENTMDFIKLIQKVWWMKCFENVFLAANEVQESANVIITDNSYYILYYKERILEECDMEK